MKTWRICEHCEHCVDDVGSGLQCDFDSPNLKSVTAEEACRYFSLDEDYVDELTEENADLRAKLAAAEKERDEAQAHNAMLRQALETLVNKYIANRGTKYQFVTCITPGGTPDYWGNAIKALSATPSDSAERAQKLYDALYKIIDDGGLDYDSICNGQKALAEWRGE